MTESDANLKVGAYFPKAALVLPMVAAGAINMWAPVVLVAAGTGETLPRVNTSATTPHKFVIGVTCGPVRESGKAADAAGDLVDVCVFGLCKCVVNGNSDNIAIGDMLINGAAGIAILADVATGEAEAELPAAFAMAWKASSADGDTIPVFVYGAMGTET